MQLLYLIVGSVIAIVLILGLHHLLGRSVAATLSGREDAVARFGELLPDEPALDAAVSRDGCSALIRLSAADRIGLLLPMGRFWAGRVAKAGDVARWSIADNVLRLTLTDFTAPAFRLIFADAGEAAQWQARLEAMRNG